MENQYRYKTKKPRLEKVSLSEMQTFFMEKVPLPHLISKWHFHEENEIILITGGQGTGFIGDGQFTFSEGTLVMIGSLTPHVWMYDNEIASESSGYAEEAIVIKFNDLLLRNYFIQIPGIDRVKALIEKSKHGILFTGDKFLSLKKKLKTINELDYFDKILLLFEILNMFSKDSDSRLVSASASLSPNQKNEISNIEKIFKFIDENFKHKITIKEVAAFANLSPTSFCRYFKSRTFKTFSRAVNEVRIEYASKLLLETNLSVSEICFQSGFNQLSNFYRCFIGIKKMTPKHFRKKILAVCWAGIELLQFCLYDFTPFGITDIL